MSNPSNMPDPAYFINVRAAMLVEMMVPTFERATWTAFREYEEKRAYDKIIADGSKASIFGLDVEWCHFARSRALAERGDAGPGCALVLSSGLAHADSRTMPKWKWGFWYYHKKMFIGTSVGSLPLDIGTLLLSATAKFTKTKTDDQS